MKLCLHWMLLPFVLTACTSSPIERPLTVATPALYREAGHWKPATGQTQIAERWWRVFGDPILDALEEQLILDNQNIKLAEAQYRAARAGLDSARATLAPTLGTTTAYSKGVNNGAGSPALASSLFMLSAQAGWEMDLWGQIRGGIAAAGARMAASEAALAAARLSAQALLAQSYFQLRASEAQIALLDRTLTGYERFLQLTRHRLAAGIASPLDEAQAQTQWLNARTQSAEARLQRAQSEHAIATLLGKPDLIIANAGTSHLPIVPQAPELIPSVTLESRYDIHAAERQVAAANAEIGIAQTAYFPVLNLSGNSSLRNPQLASLLTSPTHVWSMGPALALTLFDGGARAAAVAEAEARYDQAVAQYRQTVLAAFQEVEDHLAALRFLAEESSTQQAALAAAHKAQQIAEHQYQAGIVDSLYVISAQASALNLENATISLWNRSMAAAVQLYKNTSGRLDSAGSSQTPP